jgi:hypothetical protein
MSALEAIRIPFQPFEPALSIYATGGQCCNGIHGETRTHVSAFAGLRSIL